MASKSGVNRLGCSGSSSSQVSQGPKRTFNEISAEKLNMEGNGYLTLKNYAKAVDCYSKAIEKKLKKPVYFTNRAVAAFMMKKYDDAAADCRAALELDPIHVKGHYYLGKALCEMGYQNKGLEHLQRAVDLVKKGDDFAGKALETLNQWQQAFEGNGLQEYLSRLVREETDREIGKIQGDRRKAEAKNKIMALMQISQARLKEMNDLFKKMNEPKKTQEVPDFLCCKITLDIFKDPVITPSGITYERVAIEDHLARSRHVSPISRVPLTVDQLIPNLALKEAAAKFLEENEWATP